ncbi:MAG: proline dehydrogenase family protein [Alphaproteobacteria bacterium]
MDYSPALPPELKDRLARLYRADEEQAVADLLPQAAFDPQLLRQAQDRAASWIGKIRAHKKALPGIAEMLSHFSLDTKEGIALMCLAEALLRIPDAATADALIRDKMTAADFEAHLGQDTPWTLRAASWALNLTGRISGAHEDGHGSASAMLGLLAGKLGHGAVREAIRMAMRWLGDQFVIGHDIDAAIMRANKISDARTRYSYDMLGEGARTAEDAERYYQSYLNAIDATASNNLLYPGHAPSGISVKLSALHPRYEAAQAERVYAELVPRLVALAEASARHDIFMVVDAEEADRLLLSLGVIEKTLETAKLGAWTGFGLAVQAYQKRAPAIIDAAAHFAQKFQRRMVVRLIKGAYWDTEIKRAQERGWDEFPVYTRKMTTDVSYLACARDVAGAW